jgi:hypothetical protein
MLDQCFRIYSGHEGVVDDLDIDQGGRFLLSVGADYKVIVHEVESGVILAEHESKGFCCSCCFTATRMGQIATVQSTQMKQTPELSVFHFQVTERRLNLKYKIPFETQVNCVIWPADTVIICGDNVGRLHIINPTERKVMSCVDAHRGAINSLSSSWDHKFIAAASNEQAASIWDLELNPLGTFPHPNGLLVSCCAISPIAPHIVLASSAEKKDVASTNMGGTDFTINFFHLIYQEEFASMRAHKSTVNWVGFTPDGMTIVTTSHEGTFAVIRLGEEYAELAREHSAEVEDARNAFSSS